MEPTYFPYGLPRRLSESKIAALRSQVGKFENTLVPHHALEAALNAIERAHARYSPPEAGEGQLKGRCLLIVGESGSGKTAAIECHAGQYRDIGIEDFANECLDRQASNDVQKDSLGDGNIKRVVRIAAPGQTTPRSLAKALMTAYGCPVSKNWTADEINRRLCFSVMEMRTELIMIDEGHHLVDHQNSGGIFETFEFIKFLLNSLQVSIVIAGMPQLLESVRCLTDAQMDRRLLPAVIMSPYQWDDNKSHFLMMLKEFEKNLGLPAPSDLWDEGLAYRIYVATSGLVGLVSKYLSEALYLALSRGSSSISSDLLAEVDDNLRKTLVPQPDEEFNSGNIFDGSKVFGGSRIGHSTNPFRCPSADLNRILLQRRGAKKIAPGGLIGSVISTGRPTGLRGKGRK